MNMIISLNPHAPPKFSMLHADKQESLGGDIKWAWLHKHLFVQQSIEPYMNHTAGTYGPTSPEVW